MIQTTQTVVYKPPNKNMQEQKIRKLHKKTNFQRKIIWVNVIWITLVHLDALYGLYLAFFVGTWKLFFYVIASYQIVGLGVTAGAHRLYSHKSYKVKLPLKILLVVLQIMAGQKSIYVWARDHRVHHKFSETDADPHNPKRGIFFSHFGWLMCKKHPEVLSKGKSLDFSDLKKDAVIMFQHKYYWYMLPFALILPSLLPWYFWGEDFWISIHAALFLKFALTLNYALFINSFAHRYGYRTYDKNIGPADNPVLSFFTNGEGWHNFHHIFPWDYRSSELGSKYNITTFFIDCMAKIGWAYDLKAASNDIITKRKLRTGDHRHFG